MQLQLLFGWFLLLYAVAFWCCNDIAAPRNPGNAVVPVLPLDLFAAHCAMRMHNPYMHIYIRCVWVDWASRSRRPFPTAARRSSVSCRYIEWRKVTMNSICEFHHLLQLAIILSYCKLAALDETAMFHSSNNFIVFFITENSKANEYGKWKTVT